MDIRQLRYFVTVVQEGTITAAAAKLHMTQPPLTAQVHSLEEELGCQLFRREGRRLYLTEMGQHFFRRAEEILGMCDNAKREVADFMDGHGGTLRIGVISSVQGTLFTTWMKRFQTLHPQIKLSIYSGNTYQLLEKIQNRQMDLAVVRTPFATAELDMLYLQKEHILAVGQARFFGGNRGAEITLGELAAAPLIIYRRWQRVIEAAFETAGYPIDPYCVNDDASMTLQLALQGMGVGLLHPSALPGKLDEAIVLRRLSEETLASHIVLVCQKAGQLPRQAQLFWKLLEDAKNRHFFTDS